MRPTFLALCAALFFLSPAIAADKSEIKAVRKAMAGAIEGMSPDSIEPVPSTDLYEVTYGPRIFYVTRDARYLIQGNLFDLKKFTNLTAERQNTLRGKAVAKIDQDEMVIFSAKQPRHTVTVFTDVDCGYCRKLHSEIGEFNRLGITVRYLFFPRSGPDTPSYHKAESVWCAKDRNKAMTEAKAGKSLPRKNCDNPIDEHLALVESLGLRGTPAIILEDGRMLPGYIPATKLAAVLDGKEP